MHRGPLAAMILVLGSAHAAAQGEPILHEFFVYDRPVLAVDDTLPRLPEPGASGTRMEAGAGSTGNEELTLTAGGPVPSPGFFQDGMGGLRNGPSTPEGDVTLDRDTGPEGRLRYQALFEPSVSPWKRSAARDVIAFDGAEIVLRASQGPETVLSVAGSPPRDFDAFVGRVRIQASAGERVPIPSVAADMRFHAIRTSPPTNIEATRDSADNYWLTLEQSGQYDVEFEVSAPRHYFGGELPSSGAIPGPPLLPEALMPAARPVLDAAGVVRGMTEVDIASRLSTYFGSFEARELDPSELSEDVYTDIALGRVGVCRHRAIAFVITAAAAGLRARYVTNEAHAFVEVQFTNTGYRRIDLGGAAEGLETLGGTGAVHQPPANPLNRGGAGYDASPYPRSHQTPSAHDPRSEPIAASDAHPTQAETTHAERTPVDERPLPDSHDAREATILTARVGSERVYRGDPVTISASLRGLESGPIAGAHVVVELRDAGAGYRAELGVLVTGPDGQASERVSVPESVPSGRLNLEFRYEGDIVFAPSEVR